MAKQIQGYDPRPVLLITGGSSGIGEALAKEGAKLGYNIGIMARRLDELNRVAAACERESVKVLVFEGDVSKEEDCKHFIEQSVSQFGKINIFISNAGISMRALFEDTELDVLKTLMNINFWGAVYCAKHAMPYLKSSHGSFVAVSSIAGYKGLPARSGYSASKFALQGFIETIRTENLKNKVHIMLACPGYTASNIRNVALNGSGNSQKETPLDESKLMQPEQVAFKIFRGIRNKKREIILTPLGIQLVWFNKFFPRLADKLVYNYMKKENASPIK